MMTLEEFVEWLVRHDGVLTVRPIPERRMVKLHLSAKSPKYIVYSAEHYVTIRETDYAKFPIYSEVIEQMIEEIQNLMGKKNK